MFGLACAWTACTTDAIVFRESGETRGVGPGTRTNASDRSKPGASEPAGFVKDETGADNPAQLSAAEVTRLKAGGPLGTSRWLYPYDGTVFPRGTVSPLVMWHSDVPPDAIYLHIHAKHFDYQTITRPGVGDSLFMPVTASASSSTLIALQALGMREAGTQLAIPQVIWDLAGEQSLGASDPFTIEITQRVNGEAQGPMRAKIVIARATIKGSLYYNSCTSSLAAADNLLAGISGKVLRIPFGGNAEVLDVSAGSACIGCHTVSADGSHALAQRLQSISDDPAKLVTAETTYALSYQLGADGEAAPDTVTPIAPPMNGVAGPVGAYAALYPDGSKFLSSSSAVPLFYAPPSPSAATLYDSKSGAIVPDTGVPPSAAMPMFSPDGRFLVFNDAAIDGARALAVMSYDTRNHRAGDYRVLVREPLEAPMRPGWPVFLPDNRAIVFVRTTDPAFSGSSVGGLGAVARAAVNRMPAAGKAPSDLYIADAATGRVTLLAKAMGWNTPEDGARDEATYLPFGTQDLHANFYPTVSPVAAGGYFWVFFDSFRHFGSLGSLRLLWAAAIDIRPDGNYALDPSHPPFFVAGQEFSAGTRFRAFAVLNRCESEGEPCRTGVDCCTGVCKLPGAFVVEPSQSMGSCAPAETRCAERDERCQASSDCCDSSAACINSFCAQVELL
jgi:hypothetical protein